MPTELPKLLMRGVNDQLLTPEELEALCKADQSLIALETHASRFEKELAEVQSQITYITALKNRREAIKRRLRALSNAVRRRRSQILQREIKSRIHRIQKELNVPHENLSSTGDRNALRPLPGSEPVGRD